MMKTLYLILTLKLIFFILMDLSKLYDIQKQFIKDCSLVIEDNKIGIFSSPTGTGKTLSLLLSIKDFISEIEEEDDFLNENIIKAKIYYCSRTHSQLRQVVNEFKKLCISTRGIVLASRKSYCVNQEVDKKSSIDVINSKCKDLISENKCKFYVEHYKEKGVYTIEDLIKDSKDYEFCPYYFSKDYFKRTEIVFLPYNMLFSEDSRKSLNINLDSSIVIVDEAHNIIDTVSQINTAFIRTDDLERYIDAFCKYKKVLKDGSKNSKLVDLVIEIMRRLSSFSKRLINEKVSEISDFLVETKLHNFNTLEITEEIKDSRLFLKLEGYEKKLNLKLQDIIKFLNLLVASDISSRVECGNGFFKIFPLNPKIFFKPFKNVKSIIFAGGTMEPSDELRHIFDDRVVVNYSYQSDKRKFKGFIIDKHNGKAIEIKQTTRENSELFEGLYRMIIEITATKGGGGTVVFLPSKHYLNTFRLLFRRNEEIKCFYEDLNRFEEYAISVRRSKCLLFAVVGGTYSEGVNFSDDLCRNLIIIGVPYPNIDTVINEKIKLFGFDWYTQVAMKKVNQTIGRALRHNNDYSNIFLMDKRYLNLRRYLSSWILTNLDVCDFKTARIKSEEFLLMCSKSEIE